MAKRYMVTINGFSLETTAESKEKAISNVRWRLFRNVPTDKLSIIVKEVNRNETA